MNPTPTTEEKILEAFDEKFGSIHKDEPMPSGLKTASKIKSFLLSAMSSIREDERRKMREVIKTEREANTENNMISLDARIEIDTFLGNFLSHLSAKSDKNV